MTLSGHSSSVKKVKKSTPILTKKTPGYELLGLTAKTFPDTCSRKIRLEKTWVCTTSLNPVGRPGGTMSAAYSRRHYRMEKEATSMQWDQPSAGKKQAEIGDLFAFVMTAGEYDKMEIFEIIGLGTHHERRTHWNKDIPEQKRKGVVYLSEYIGWVSSTEYVKAIKETGGKVPAVRNNKNAGKLLMSNGTQMYPWSSEILVNVP